MWLSVVCTLIDNDKRHHSGQNVVVSSHEAQPSESATNWATPQSARVALVSEYVSSIHPWANNRCRISQSERALCFSYVIKSIFKKCTTTLSFKQDTFRSFNDHLQLWIPLQVRLILYKQWRISYNVIQYNYSKILTHNFKKREK